MYNFLFLRPRNGVFSIFCCTDIVLLLDVSFLLMMAEVLTLDSYPGLMLLLLMIERKCIFLRSMGDFTSKPSSCSRVAVIELECFKLC